jgi:hypothetical protein
MLTDAQVEVVSEWRRAVATAGRPKNRKELDFLARLLNCAAEWLETGQDELAAR